MPSDTRESFANTVKFSKKIRSTYAQFSVFTPYPGTPVYKNYKDKITKLKYEDFTQWQLVFKHNNLSENDVLDLLDNSYKDYYTNPKWLIHYANMKLKEFYENMLNRL